jgi:hypothetical protein
MPNQRKSRAARKAAAPAPPTEARLRAERNRRLLIAAAVIAGLAAVGVVLAFTLGSGGGGSSGSASLPLGSTTSLGSLQAPGAAGPIGPEGVPVPNAPTLAPPASPGLGQSVDGIQCQTTEQVIFHIHAHLTVFVAGAQRRIPYGVGIAPPRQVQSTPSGPFVVSGACFSWLHTHAYDGIVHIESPVRRTYTLGNFFDIWKQPLTRERVGPARGKVTAFFNGRLYTGNPRSIPLLAHAQIQLDVGSPLVAQQTIQSWNGL